MLLSVALLISSLCKSLQPDHIIVGTPLGISAIILAVNNLAQGTAVLTVVIDINDLDLVLLLLLSFGWWVPPHQ